MATYTAKILWQRRDQVFTDNKYNRAHEIFFDGGFKLHASSSPNNVPLPYSDPSAVDPEEMLVASLSNCHMLWFLSLAAKEGFCIDIYEDNPIGEMQKNPQGKLFLSKTTLHPKIIFSGAKIPTEQEIVDLHEKAHAECFIANSVLTKIICVPIFEFISADLPTFPQ